MPRYERITVYPSGYWAEILVWQGAFQEQSDLQGRVWERWSETVVATAIAIAGEDYAFPDYDGPDGSVVLLVPAERTTRLQQELEAEGFRCAVREPESLYYDAGLTNVSLKKGSKRWVLVFA